MRQITGYASVAALLLALTACGDDGGGDSPSAEDCSGPPEVTVSSTGSEPLKPMELSPTVGDTQALDVKMTMGMSAKVDGDTAPTGDIPPMSFGMKMTVDEVTDEEIKLSFVYDKAEVEGGDPTMQGLLDSLVGASGSVTTTRFGAYVDGDFTADGLDPQLAQMVDQLDQQMADMTIPLPEEPVGVGAEWEVVSSIEANGITSCNTANYELVEFDGDAYELAVDLTQQTVPTTTEEGGATVEVVSGSGSSTGQNSGSLSLPITVSGSSEGSTSMEMKVEQGGQEFDQEVDVDITLEIMPRG